MMCQAFDARLAKNTSKLFLAGDKLSIADFAYAGRYFNFVQNDLSMFPPQLRQIHD